MSKQTGTMNDDYFLEQNLEVIDRIKAEVEEADVNDDSRRSLLANYIKGLLLRVPTQVVLNYDLHNTLWTACFYECRIQRLRRSKHEDVFKTFLGNSIEFFKATIHEYKSSKHCKPQGNNSSTRDSTTEDEHYNSSAVLLNSLYTRLGDLYRYKKDWTDAERAYRRAIDAHPCIDSPYNTIGVIQVEKECYLDALYFFYRSYTAAFRNIPVLFDKNFEFLSINIPSTEYDKLNAGVGPVSQGLKKKIMKLLFGEFVETHRMFYAFSTLSSAKHAIAEISKIDRLQQYADTFLGHFGFLLKEEILSDSLLLKMIVVNIFNVVNLDKCILGRPMEQMDVFKELDNQHKMRLSSIPSIALNFAYRFVTVLISQLKTSIANNDEVEKLKSGDSMSSTGNRSLRCIMALQLFCDWLSTSDIARRLANQDEHYVSEQAAAAAYAEQQNFFASIASAWNDLSDVNEYASSVGKRVTQINNEVGQQAFKEHFELRGIPLFANFIPQASEKSFFSLDGKQELEGRIGRLFNFLFSCQDLLVLDKHGHFHLQPEDESLEGSFADDVICSTIEKDFFSCEAKSAFGVDGRPPEFDAADDDQPHLSPPNISDNFNAHHDFVDSSGTDVAAGNSEVYKSVPDNMAEPSSFNRPPSQSITDERDIQQFLRYPNSRQEPSAPIHDESVNSHPKSTLPEVCKDDTPQLSNEKFARFIKAVTANPFEVHRLSMRSFKETSGHHHMQNQPSNEKVCRPETQSSAKRFARFISAALSNPFEANRISLRNCREVTTSRSSDAIRSNPVQMEQNSAVGSSLNKHSEHYSSKNISTSSFYPTLPTFAKHNDPQSLLFDYHPGLSTEERAARNALILYGIHQKPGLSDQEQYAVSRKRRFPF